MSLLLKLRKSCRFLSHQSKQHAVPSFPRPSAPLGLQNVRALRSPFAFHGSACTAASFSSAAEVASMAAPSVHSEDMDNCRDGEPESAPALAMEQEEVVLRKLVEENRHLFTVLQAELENQRISANSILEEIRALKAQEGAEVDASKISSKAKHVWPEWNVFVEYLQSSGFFKGEVKSSHADTVLDEPECVKRAIDKFSQVQDAIYESLSQMDLRILAKHGSVANDQKAAESKARLRQYFEAENQISNSAAKSISPQPKLTDVTRLIFSTVSAAQADAFLSDAKLSISHLLREIISLSSKPKTSVASPREAITPSGAALVRASDLLESSKQERHKPIRVEKKQDLSKVKPNKIEDAVKSADKAEVKEEASTKLQQWKCPRCSFMNLDSKHRCAECSRVRPQSTLGVGTAMNTEEVSLGDELLEALDDEKPKKAHESSKRDRPSTAQVRQGMKGRSLVEEDEDTDMEASDTELDVSSKGGSGSENDLDILDDILESEDEPRGKGRRGAMSDLSDDEPRGYGKKTRLSELVPQKHSAPIRKGGDLGKKAGRWPPTKGRRFDEVDDDGSNEEEAGRFEARGGKFGRGRGDSYNGRRNGGGGRGYSDRDRSYGDKNGGYGDRDRGYGDRDRSSRGFRGRSRY